MRDLSKAPEHRERILEMERVLLVRLESTLPEARRAPRDLSLEDKLDWHLVPPEERGARNVVVLVSDDQRFDTIGALATGSSARPTSTDSSRAASPSPARSAWDP